jgi:hypothetical protein
MMDEELDWTHKLGDAFLAQQKDVMDTVQKLRGKAKEAGNLESTEQQTVQTEVQGEQTVVIIESTEPETVYVQSSLRHRRLRTHWLALSAPAIRWPWQHSWAQAPKNGCSRAMMSLTARSGSDSSRLGKSNTPW